MIPIYSTVRGPEVAQPELPKLNLVSLELQFHAGSTFEWPPAGGRGGNFLWRIFWYHLY